MNRSVTKDIYYLMRDINKLSDGQAMVVNFQEQERTLFVSITPNSGLYGNGQFIFKIYLAPNYPSTAPEVTCLTPIYHPNIENLLVFGEDYGEICVSLLDEWQSCFNLDHVVQAILFLFYHPNLEDPFSPLFVPNMDYTTFANCVKLSLEGGIVDDFTFPRNRCNEDSSSANSDNVIAERIMDWNDTHVCREQNNGDIDTTNKPGVVKSGIRSGNITPSVTIS
ncbi:uncharacterized protein LOC100374153 [Saccoglossus kowalevskii]|uniref:NEDD8-conjugating enzyme Ubc12-like n=1 Tax=Saccoglossus kowalevskii TaxID=10224 RepID=A0ABM0GJN3_SACKO|nr:PREDICTED: NEDD8-conjugating enzyme Ubc12-like [Saccoglossus kowalevskii]